MCSCFCFVKLCYPKVKTPPHPIHFTNVLSQYMWKNEISFFHLTLYILPMYSRSTCGRTRSRSPTLPTAFYTCTLAVHVEERDLVLPPYPLHFTHVLSQYMWKNEISFFHLTLYILPMHSRSTCGRTRSRSSTLPSTFDQRTLAVHVEERDLVLPPYPLHLTNVLSQYTWKNEISVLQ